MFTSSVETCCCGLGFYCLWFGCDLLWLELMLCRGLLVYCVLVCAECLLVWFGECCLGFSVLVWVVLNSVVLFNSLFK